MMAPCELPGLQAKVLSMLASMYGAAGNCFPPDVMQQVRVGITPSWHHWWRAL